MHRAYAMDKYHKIKMIGKGAFGTVYLTSRIRDKKLLILKEINVEDMTKDERGSAITEVQILKRLNHPNIIKYYENFLDEKNLVIAMEYAQGGTLHQFLSQQTALLKEEKVWSLFIQIVVALQYIHTHNILHRDLNTNNLLLDRKCRVVKLSDFGISKILNTKTKASSVVGTPCYISPELCESNPYNQKSDVWALGCLLYELMTLRKAFEAQSLPALVMKIVHGDYNKELLPNIYHPALKRLLMSMLDLAPDKRPAVSDIMAEAHVTRHLIHLYCNIGAVDIRHDANMTSSGKGRNNNATSWLHHTTSTMSVESLSGKKRLDYRVYFWGGGNALPTRLPLPNSHTQVVQATISRTRKACVTENGRLIMWEASSASGPPGLMGDSQNIASYIPRFLEGQSGVTIKQVVCGDLHTACLTDRGILMTYGSGSNGCLGHGSFLDVDKPMIVEKLLGYELSHIASGSYHMLAVTTDGEVFAWGKGDNGRLGLNNKDETCNIPTLVTIPQQVEAKSVHCGTDCSMILTTNQHLLACGSNLHNRLGLDSIHDGVMLKETIESSCFVPLRSEPVSLGSISQVSLGMQHSAVITTDGDLITFGNNSCGQLGSSDHQPLPRFPFRVTALNNVKFGKVGCGGTFTVAASRNHGNIYSWGKATRGQLGRTTSTQSTINPPQEVALTHLPNNPNVVSLAVSHGNAIAVISGTESDAGGGGGGKFRNSWDTNTWREESNR